MFTPRFPPNHNFQSETFLIVSTFIARCCVVTAHLAGGDGGHGVLVPRQGEGSVHDPPVPLQGNVPTVTTISQLEKICRYI